MAAAVAIPSSHSSTPNREASPPPSLHLNTTSHGTPAPVPNKYIPFCSPGPQPTYGLPSPPASPPSPTASSSLSAQHVLFPPDPNSRLCHEPPVYALSAETLRNAYEHAANLPLPDPGLVFPWLHGLHNDNHIQLTFFGAKRRVQRRAPRALRGLTIVKANGDLERSRLKGAVAPDELLPPLGSVSLAPCFHDVDPRVGFSVRNFQIQTCKMATVSDIVVYGDDATCREDVETLAKIISQAQINHRAENADCELEEFNTFVLTDTFAHVEQEAPQLVAVNSAGNMTGSIMSFPSQERNEMSALTKASEIAPNVWLGQTPDSTLTSSQDDSHFDILIEANDDATIPLPNNLDEIEAFLNDNDAERAVAHLEFPASGSFAATENGIQSHVDVSRILRFFHWLNRITHGTSAKCDEDGDFDMNGDSPPRRVLIHCQDGYTETTLLGVAYSMFARGIPAHDAWIRMHKDLGRDFFSYATDKFFLENIQIRLLQESPALESPPAIVERPEWMRRMDGSLPSRILPYLYLGNLNHAQNPEMLRLLGIKRILSVGEPILWPTEDADAWGLENFMYVDKVQDNGVDPLTAEIESCLRFIEEGKRRGEATLVHCRVGVSRSATICIAEVMTEKGLSFPRAYCFVRARRLNVIIQPHLRFSYELLKYEELQRTRLGLPIRRELEWPTIAREIALMNKPYCRQ